MKELQVKVRFDNITVGAIASVITTPISTFVVGGWQYSIDLNGEFQKDGYIGGGVDNIKLTDANGGRWKFAPDSNGELTKELEGYFGGGRTFMVIQDGNDVIYCIGVDLNGEFDTQYLQ